MLSYPFWGKKKKINVPFKHIMQQFWFISDLSSSWQAFPRHMDGVKRVINQFPASNNIKVQWQRKVQKVYLPTTGSECFCPVNRYSTIIVKATVVRLRVVYMGTFMPRTASIVINFQQKRLIWGKIKRNIKALSNKKYLKYYHVKQIWKCQRKSVN